jgi:hypothetical protein
MEFKCSEHLQRCFAQFTVHAHNAQPEFGGASKP